MTTRRPPLDAAGWARLSPWLDELLELDAPARAARLATLRADDAPLADQLAALLAAEVELDRGGFLAGHAVDAPPTSTLSGRRIGAYTLERELGAGGMGSVWLGRRHDGRFEGEVAIKLPNLALLVRGGAERFEREGSVLGRLSHPNIARLLDAGVADGQPYLVLEYVDGQPIDRWCDANALGIRARLRLFLDVLAAVAHAHTSLVLHRDLKPSNILVDRAGRVKLLDFGVAKLLADAGGAASELTLEAGRAFTPEYAAPEQVRGEPVTTATDVYALGVLLYVLLGGRHPTAMPSAAPHERLRATLESEPPTLSDIAQRTTPAAAAARASTAPRLARDLRGDLDNVVAKALKKAPAERYPTVGALADDLQRYLDHRPVSARPDSLGYRTAKFLRRYRLVVGAASATLLALLAGVIGTTWQAWEAQRQRDRALAVSARDEAMVEFVEVMLTEAARGDQPLKVRDLLARSRDLIDRRVGGSADSDAAVLVMLGRFLVTLGEPAAAERNLRLAAERAAASPDRALRGLIDCHLALALSMQGRREEATARFADAMPLARDDPSAEADCHQAQAYVAQNHNDAAGALRHAQRALELRRASGRARPLLEASLLGSVAYAHYLAGDALQADRHYAQSVAQFRAAGATDTAMLVTILNNWGIASFAAGDVRRAFACYDEALQIAGRLARGTTPPPYLFANRGLAHLTLANYRAALDDFDRARALGEANGSPAFVASGLAGRALALREQGDRGGAQTALREARQLIGSALPADSVPGISLRTTAARIALLDGRADEARTLYGEVIDFFDRRGMQVGPVVTALRGRAEARATQGELPQAAADLERALALARRLQGDKPHSTHTGLTLASLARLHGMQGQAAQAQAQARLALEHLLPMLGETHPETQHMKRVAAAP